jgi:hypothetical protein
MVCLEELDSKAGETTACPALPGTEQKIMAPVNAKHERFTLSP